MVLHVEKILGIRGERATYRMVWYFALSCSTTARSPPHKSAFLILTDLSYRYSPFPPPLAA